MPPQHLLNYEPVPPKPPPIWRRSLALWVIICIVGYCFALIGPVFVAAGVLSFYVDPSGSLPISIVGVPVQTMTEKLVWTLSNLVIGVLGLGFVAYAPPSQVFQRREITRQL